MAESSERGTASQSGRLRSLVGQALRPGEQERRKAQSLIDSLRDSNNRLRSRAARLRDHNGLLRQKNDRLQSRLERQRKVIRHLRDRLAASSARTDGGPLREHALAHAVYHELLERLTIDEDFPTAAIETTRALLALRGSSSARSFAQLVQHQRGWSATGDVCVAIVVQEDPMPDTAWRLFSRQSLPFVLQVAPVEYIRAAFHSDPAAAEVSLEAVRRGEHAMATDAQGWLTIAQLCFAAQREQLCRWALQHANEQVETHLGAERGSDPDSAPRFKTISEDVRWLDGWLDRTAPAPAELPSGEIPIAVTRLQHPDRAKTSTDPRDYVEALAVLTQLARHRGFRFSGATALAEFARELARATDQQRAIPGRVATVRLYEVDRDVSSSSTVPDCTWLVVSGELPQDIFGLRTELPFDARLRPIFVSVHIDRPLLLTDEVLAYLRRYAPIGCRDWRTVALLQAASVPAFFAGALGLTLDDAPPTGGGRPATVHATSLADALAAALALVEDLRSSDTDRITADLETYLVARAVGAPVDFRPRRPSDPRLDGIGDLDDDAVSRIRQGLTAKLEAVFGAIAAGKSEDEIYELWRSACATEVAHAEAWRHDVAPIPPPTFDVARACADAHRDSVVHERSEPGPAGEEIAVEFSLDANYERQLAVVLHSIVTRCTRPLRAFVLCRELGPEVFARFAALFPTVSFVWLPTDHVEYGEISGMIKHITVATMDRLLLPDLLPKVTRIIHHDLDALCLADLAELFDFDLVGNPVAARDNPTPNFGSGFLSIINYARRLDEPALATELIRRTHLMHQFDYEVFNAGIVVLDLEQMRADDFTRRYLPFAQRFGMNDQAVLNVYAGRRRTALPSQWNQFPRNEIVDENTKILHWLGAGKPWRNTYIGARELWIEAEQQFAAREARVAS